VNNRPLTIKETNVFSLKNLKILNRCITSFIYSTFFLFIFDVKFNIINNSHFNQTKEKTKLKEMKNKKGNSVVYNAIIH
jgi:hypothetical protein